MELQLKITGGILIALALMHIDLPRHFKWKEELAGLSLISRQIQYVHTFFIAFTVLLMGVLCIVATDDLLHTSLGHTICLGLFIFWFVRWVFQLTVYSSKLWRGKRFETIVHVVASVLWTYLSVLFWVAYRSA